MSRRSSLLAFTGWLTAALVATGLGIGAVRFIDTGFQGAGGDVLTPEQVVELLGTATPAPAPTPSPSAGQAQPGLTAGPSRPLSGPGGTVVAACTGGLAYLWSWTPAQGYGVERVERGPYEHADVRFEGSAGRSQVRVRCVAGEPTAQWTD